MPFKKQTSVKAQPSTYTKTRFIGRTNELLFFIHHILEPEEPTYNILSIFGQGGVGKSTLINRLMAESAANNFKDYCLTAKVDDRQTTPASIMEHFADQLREAGHPLKKFEEILADYKESLRRMQLDHKEEQEIVVREVVDVAGTVVEDIPFAGGLMHRGATTVTELLIDKAHRSQRLKDAARLEDPIGNLTRAFVKALNQITDAYVNAAPSWMKRHRRIILFFDTFEQLASDTSPWLLDYFLEAEINPDVVLVIAGRDSIENSLSKDPKRWLPYLDNQDIYLIPLDGFTEQETSSYLEERGITDPTKVNQIWHMSRGLPLYLGLLTSNPEGNVDPTSDVVENFLRWIPRHEHLKRRLALEASLFSLPFNQDDLAAFTYLDHNVSELYQWLIGQSFVRSNPQNGRHSYHESAQEMFSRHLYQRSPKEWCVPHQALADYYQQCVDRLQVGSGKEIYKTTEWLDLILAFAQQMFFLPDEASYRKAVEHIILAYEHASEMEKITRVLRNLSQKREGSLIDKRNLQTIDLLLQCIETDIAKQNQELLVSVSTLLKLVANIPSFSTEALAHLYRRRGYINRVLEKYEQALSDYDKALALLSDYERAFVGRGRTYHLRKNYQQAIADFDRAIELNHKDEEYYNSRGLAYYGLKDYERAIEDYTHALELDPEYKWAYDNRGDAYRGLKDYERAIEDYTRALELDPQYVRVYNSRGLAYYGLKDYEHAIEDYTHALELDPKYKWAYANRGYVYKDMEDHERAIEDYNRAFELDPHYVYAYIGRGVTYIFQKEYERAIEDYNRALELDPHYVYAYNNRGFAYSSLKNYNCAIEDYTHALELDPEYEWAYANRGDAYRGLKDYERALQNYNRALELDPQYVNACHSRGLAYYGLKDYERAIEDYTHALELDPKHKWAYDNRGDAYRELKNYGQAIEDYNRVLELDPQYIRVYNGRGQAYYGLKDYEHAIQDFTRVIELNPKDTWVYSYRGLTYYRMKNYNRAIEDYTHALELDPAYKWAYANRGHAYGRLKDYERAIQDCNRALELDSEYAWAYHSQGYIYLWLRDLVQAKAAFVRSWQFDSTDVGYGWMVEFVGMCQQKPDLAMVKRLEVIAQVDSQSSVAYTCRGIAQWLQGQFVQALEMLEHTSNINPDSEDAFFWKGIVLASLRRNDEAITAIGKSLELDLPPVLLAPLHWFEQDRPEFYEKCAKPLLMGFA